MRPNYRNSMCALVLVLSIVSVQAGCAGKHISTSVANQTFEPGRPKVAAAMPPPSLPPPSSMSSPPAPVEETRVVEAPVSPPPQPPMVEQPAQTTAAPSVVELVDAYFDFDRSTLRNDARSALEADARTLKSELKETKILIEGHCDEVGTVAYNLVLGEKRAQAVKRYLQDLGVSSSRMQTASLGKERPFCTDHNPECWQNNRRAHFSVQ